MPQTALKPLLEFSRVSKKCGAIWANQEVSFRVKRGTIHAIIGENGAGKSTAMKILFGLISKDSGQIFLNGEPLEVSGPLEAKKLGFGMVHQHFMLAGPIRALDHLFLDEKSLANGLWHFFQPLRRKKLLAELEALSNEFQMPVPWEKSIDELSVGFQQRIEIFKLLYNKAEIFILDEPTAVLSPQEIENLFSQLRSLRDAGKTILIVTHKLKEVMALADEVTVFRQGRVVAQRPVEKTSSLELSELMVGRKLPEFRKPSPLHLSGIPLFEIKNLSLNSKFQNLQFAINPGEIVGIAGIEGHGQSDLIEVLLDPLRFKKDLKGDLCLKGQSLLKATPRKLKELGISFFPEDRLGQGALTGSSMKDNFILGLQRHPLFSFYGWLREKKISEVTSQQMTHFDVRPALPKAVFRTYSGGNQQKFVVARELYRQPCFLVAAQPTRGVDVGAIERIHEEMIQLKERGGAILLISSDLDEVLKLSDHVHVFYEGKIAGSLRSGKWDESIIGRLMTGGSL